MKKFQLKLVSEKFVTISVENEDELMKTIERIHSNELRDLAGVPEWDVVNVDRMPDEITTDVVLADGKIWTVS